MFDKLPGKQNEPRGEPRGFLHPGVSLHYHTLEDLCHAWGRWRSNEIKFGGVRSPVFGGSDETASYWKCCHPCRGAGRVRDVVAAINSPKDCDADGKTTCPACRGRGGNMVSYVKCSPEAISSTGPGSKIKEQPELFLDIEAALDGLPLENRLVMQARFEVYPRARAGKKAAAEMSELRLIFVNRALEEAEDRRINPGRFAKILHRTTRILSDITHIPTEHDLKKQQDALDSAMQ